MTNATILLPLGYSATAEAVNQLLVSINLASQTVIGKVLSVQVNMRSGRAQIYAGEFVPSYVGITSFTCTCPIPSSIKLSNGI